MTNLTDQSLDILKELGATAIISNNSYFSTAFQALLRFHGCYYRELATPLHLSDLLSDPLPEQVVIIECEPLFVELISQIKLSSPATKILVISSNPSPQCLLEYLTHGADDAITTSSPTEIAIALLKLNIHSRRSVRTSNSGQSTARRNPLAGIIAQSPQMLAIFETVNRLADYNTTVLITGESGTGKELLARAIHDSSPRNHQPFLAINCGAIPESLIESELFGHRKGAFTDATKDKRGLFEEANQGTIFLDEIGDLPLHLQVKLLRVLQEQFIRRVGDEQVIPIDVRIIAATLRDLEEDVIVGTFRNDLFYRLNVVSIHLSPLRERPSDIPLLVNHFLSKHAKRLGLKPKKLTPEVLDLLLKYNWKGNARELENAIERCLVLSRGDQLDIECLPDYIRKEIESSPHNFKLANNDNLSIKQRTKELEIELITRALHKTKGNRTHAAKILELSHRALLYKLKEYNIRGT